MRRFCRGIVICIALLAFVPGPLNAASGRDAFRLGVGAFQSGDYAAARRHFEQARHDGIETAALHYNLGSTFFKLGMYGQARASFEITARDPAWAPLAHYNLGLVSLAQEKTADAAREFLSAWRATDDDALAQLAFTMLERIDPLALTEPRSRVSLSLGYDSNVVLGDQPGAGTYASDADFYWELIASATGRVDTAADSPRWSAGFYDLRYIDLRGFNISELAAALDFPADEGEWRRSVGGQWRHAWRDGGAFQQVLSLRADAERPGAGQDPGVRFAISIDAIDILDSNYAFLDGSRWSLSMSLNQAVAPARMQYGVSYEHNDRADYSAQGNRYSFSPDRTSLWWRGSWPYAGRWQINPELRHVEAQYSGSDRHNGLNQPREDKEWRAGVSTSYRLPFPWQMIGEFTYATNRSNFPEFTYHRYQLSIGIQRPF